MAQRGWGQESGKAKEGVNTVVDICGYAQQKGKESGILFCSFLSSGEITFINEEGRLKLKGNIGDNFLKMLDAEERKRVKMHLATYTPETPVRWHIEDVNGIKVRWVNKVSKFVDGKPVEFDSIGWMVQEENSGERNAGLER